MLLASFSSSFLVVIRQCGGGRRGGRFSSGVLCRCLASLDPSFWQGWSRSMIRKRDHRLQPPLTCSRWRRSDQDHEMMQMGVVSFTGGGSVRFTAPIGCLLRRVIVLSSLKATMFIPSSQVARREAVVF